MSTNPIPLAAFVGMALGGCVLAQQGAAAGGATIQLPAPPALALPAAPGPVAAPSMPKPAALESAGPGPTPPDAGGVFGLTPKEEQRLRELERTDPIAFQAFLDTHPDVIWPAAGGSQPAQPTSLESLLRQREMARKSGASAALIAEIDARIATLRPGGTPSRVARSVARAGRRAAGREAVATAPPLVPVPMTGAANEAPEPIAKLARTSAELPKKRRIQQPRSATRALKAVGKRHRGASSRIESALGQQTIAPAKRKTRPKTKPAKQERPARKGKRQAALPVEETLPRGQGLLDGRFGVEPIGATLKVDESLSR